MDSKSAILYAGGLDESQDTKLACQGGCTHTLPAAVLKHNPLSIFRSFRRCATMIMSMRIAAMMLVLTALSSAAPGTTAARPLDSSGWPLEALAAVEASCDGCFDPVAAVEVD